MTDRAHNRKAYPSQSVKMHNFNCVVSGPAADDVSPRGLDTKDLRSAATLYKSARSKIQTGREVEVS
jgi:hypothetical protein